MVGVGWGGGGDGFGRLREPTRWWEVGAVRDLACRANKIEDNNQLLSEQERDVGFV